ncbi:unnamed protein product, partial [Phaeothamnion confervicola]
GDDGNGAGSIRSGVSETSFARPAGGTSVPWCADVGGFGGSGCGGCGGRGGCRTCVTRPSGTRSSFGCAGAGTRKPGCAGGAGGLGGSGAASQLGRADGIGHARSLRQGSGGDRRSSGAGRPHRRHCIGSRGPRIAGGAKDCLAATAATAVGCRSAEPVIAARGGRGGVGGGGGCSCGCSSDGGDGGSRCGYSAGRAAAARLVCCAASARCLDGGQAGSAGAGYVHSGRPSILLRDRVAGLPGDYVGRNGWDLMRSRRCRGICCVNRPSVTEESRPPWQEYP